PQLGPGHARQREAELGARTGLSPRLQPPAVQLRVLPGDRQAEPGASGGAGAGGAAGPEAVEDRLTLPRLEPDPMVAYCDGHGVAVGGHGHDDVLALAVLDGVDEQVAQDAFDTATVDLRHARLPGQLQNDLAALALRQPLDVAHHAQDEVALV